MEARTVNNPPSAASHDETVRCVLAIELSKKSWIVAVNTPLSDKVSCHTLEVDRADSDAGYGTKSTSGGRLVLRGGL